MFCLALLVGYSLTVLAQAVAPDVDITGSWRAAFDSQIGRQQYTYEFQLDGNRLTGKAEGSAVGELEIQNGRVEGSSVSFIEVGTYQGNEFRIQYSGIVKSPVEIAFTRRVIGVVSATEEIVATRVE